MQATTTRNLFRKNVAFQPLQTTDRMLCQDPSRAKRRSSMRANLAACSSFNLRAFELQDFCCQGEHRKVWKRLNCTQPRLVALGPTTCPCLADAAAQARRKPRSGHPELSASLENENLQASRALQSAGSVLSSDRALH